MKISSEKLSVLNIMCILLLPCMRLNADSYVQISRFSMHFDRVEIKTVLEEIKKRTEFDFIYDENEVRPLGLVNVHLEDASFRDVLNEVLKNSNLTFKVVNKTIILVNRTEFALQQRQIIVKGYVYDESGTPLPGVTVRVKGKTTGGLPILPEVSN